MKKYFLSIFLFAQILFLQIIKSQPDVVESFYSNRLYPKISFVSRKIFGFSMISIGDVIYGMTIILIILWIYKSFKNWKTNWKSSLLNIINFISILYFTFHVLWGYNYYRESLSEKMNIDTNYSDQELVSFTEKMIKQTNETHLLITKNVNKKVIVSYSQEQIFDLCKNGYENLSKNYPIFKHENQSLKKSLFSVPLSYMGFSGYLNPFTNEAQVNSEMPMYGFAMTATHEMAHQIGFASESECNFIGYLAAISNDDVYVRYSAESFALRYSLRFLQIKNDLKFNDLKAKVNRGIFANYKESDNFWKQHESIVETGFKIFYDNFLKVNKQKDGLVGYGKFMNLLIGFERKNENISK